MSFIYFEKQNMSKIVVLGAGIAGHTAAYSTPKKVRKTARSTRCFSKF
jgi:predicted NAD/FAD-binding protein